MVALAVALGKRLHHAVDLLGLARQPEVDNSFRGSSGLGGPRSIPSPVSVPLSRGGEVYHWGFVFNW